MGISWVILGPTSLGLAVLATVDQQVPGALRAERQKQVLDHCWDEGQ